MYTTLVNSYSTLFNCDEQTMMNCLSITAGQGTCTFHGGRGQGTCTFHGGRHSVTADMKCVHTFKISDWALLITRE